MPEQLDAPPDRLVFRSILPDLNARAAFDRWTVPERLQAWWPPVAEIEPHVGGSYHFLWPSQDWHLRGTFTAYQPGKRLIYTWRWDHDPVDEVTEVEIVFEPHSGGSVLTLTHGLYADTEAGRKHRQEHHDGWMYFLGRLEALR